MYNRYVRNDKGEYRRIPVQQDRAEGKGEQAQAKPPPGSTAQKDSLLSGILGKLRLDDIDTGDLLLLVILFLLFRDGEDEELIIALGLLLIL